VAINLENGILIFGRPKAKEDHSKEEPVDLRSC
jgi:hypothetical protein